jgi:hypothetical protein
LVHQEPSASGGREASEAEGFAARVLRLPAFDLEVVLTYFHGVSTYSFGDMWVHTSNGSLFHDPNQVQVEFLGDVAGFSAVVYSGQRAPDSRHLCKHMVSHPFHQRSWISLPRFSPLVSEGGNR